MSQMPAMPAAATIEEANSAEILPSRTNTLSSKPVDLKRYSIKTEPKLSQEKSKSKTKDDSSFTPEEFDNVPAHPPMTTIPRSKSQFQLKMEERKSELLREKQKLRQLQQEAFEKQVQAQQLQNFKRLYDIWQEYATNSVATLMDIQGLTASLKVFGMIIDTDRDFQKHIFRKFDIDNEKEITYNDFSATIASFVGSNTDDDALQTLFEIFDNENKGYLEMEGMARILLAQNQIALIVTGQQKAQIVYTKKQCLKQARRMVNEYDSDEFNDDKISFNEFKAMMNSRTEDDMYIAHMKAPSISVQTQEQNTIPLFVPNDNDD
jgi:Ca2+-binding EF-hand superfamily protein